MKLSMYVHGTFRRTNLMPMHVPILGVRGWLSFSYVTQWAPSDSYSHDPAWLNLPNTCRLRKKRCGLPVAYPIINFLYSLNSTNHLKCSLHFTNHVNHVISACTSNTLVPMHEPVLGFPWWLLFLIFAKWAFHFVGGRGGRTSNTAAGLWVPYNWAGLSCCFTTYFRGRFWAHLKLRGPFLYMESSQQFYLCF